ncbi:MAG: oligosaccharide flippase family protein [Bacteroidota bacterium]|nr:MAG: oligosaccharide flippase family protein [Bacteroidota bacterium]
MKKRFVENLAFFFALNLLIKPIYVFGIDRVVQNTVGTLTYGSYFPLFNLVLIFQIFLDLGIENYSRKEIAHNPGLSHRLLSGLLGMKILLSLLFILVFSTAGFFVLPSLHEWQLFVVIIINQTLASFILFLRANMGGLQLFKSESIISVVDRFAMILICGSLLLIPVTKNQFRIEWFVYAQFAAYLLSLSLSLLIVLHKSRKISLSIKWKHYIPLLRQLSPYALLLLLMSVYYRIDSVFLRYLLPDGREQAGIYAQSFRIVDFLANYALIFSLILLPTFSKLLREREEISSLLKTALLILLVPAASMLIALIFYRYPLFQFLYPGSPSESADIFMILTLSFIGMCISYTFGALLTANGNLKELIVMAFVAVGISLTLNILLVPLLKATGAAIANASAQLFAIVYHIVVVKKKFILKTDWSLLIRANIFIVFALVFAYLILHSNLEWIPGIILTVVSILILSLFSQLIKISQLVSFILTYLPRKDLSTS